MSTIEVRAKSKHPSLDGITRNTDPSEAGDCPGLNSKISFTSKNQEKCSSQENYPAFGGKKFKNPKPEYHRDDTRIRRKRSGSANDESPEIKIKKLSSIFGNGESHSLRNGKSHSTEHGARLVVQKITAEEMEGVKSEHLFSENLQKQYTKNLNGERCQCQTNLIDRGHFSSFVRDIPNHEIRLQLEKIIRLESRHNSVGVGEFKTNKVADSGSAIRPGGLGHSGDTSRSEGFSYSRGAGRSEGFGYSGDAGRSEGFGYSRGAGRSESFGYSGEADRPQGFDYSGGAGRSEGFGYSGGAGRSEDFVYTGGAGRSEGFGYFRDASRSEGISDSGSAGIQAVAFTSESRRGRKSGHGRSVEKAHETGRISQGEGKIAGGINKENTLGSLIKDIGRLTFRNLLGSRSDKNENKRGRFKIAAKIKNNPNPIDNKENKRLSNSEKKGETGRSYQIGGRLGFNRENENIETQDTLSLLQFHSIFQGHVIAIQRNVVSIQEDVMKVQRLKFPMFGFLEPFTRMQFLILKIQEVVLSLGEYGERRQQAMLLSDIKTNIGLIHKLIVTMEQYVMIMQRKAAKSKEHNDFLLHSLNLEYNILGIHEKFMHITRCVSENLRLNL